MHRAPVCNVFMYSPIRAHEEGPSSSAERVFSKWGMDSSYTLKTKFG